MIVSNMGTWMQNVANGWLVLQLTSVLEAGFATAPMVKRLKKPQGDQSVAL
ncbi:MAG TPA: hypothetical protein VF918_00270 [Anaerolineales bacterium]